MRRILRFIVIVIAVLLVLTLGFGLCSALGLALGTLGLVEAQRTSVHHAQHIDFTMAFFEFSVPGLLFAALCGWGGWTLFRRGRRTGA